jgi:hypothetical protein
MHDDSPQTKNKQWLKKLDIMTYRRADESVRQAFRQLVLPLTPDEDDENGPDTWEWVVANNAIFPDDGPYDTFLFMDVDSGEVLATGTFTIDDRDALKTNGIKAFGVIGFVNVLQRQLRGGGLGNFVCDFLDEHIQDAVDRSGSPQDVYLFTETPGYYARRGFEETGVKIPFLGKEEPLWRKTYVNQ